MPFSLTIALATLVLACGGRQTTGPGPTEVATTSFEPAPIYAALFVEDRSWEYDARREAAFWDDSDPAADESGMVTDGRDWTFTCRAADVRWYPSAVASDIDCEGEDDDTLEGVYVATPNGLWRVTEMPVTVEETLAQITGDPLVPADPEPASVREDYDEDGMEAGSEVALESDPDLGWCHTESYWGGDESSQWLCVDEGLGITAAGHSFAGGSLQETRVLLADMP